MRPIVAKRGKPGSGPGNREAQRAMLLTQAPSVIPEKAKIQAKPDIEVAQ